jgi:nitronate monooxygenase
MTAEVVHGTTETVQFTLHPSSLIQAPMAGVSTPQLAAAVSNAGGVGSISIGAMNLTQARDALLQTRQLTAHPFNVNVFCHAPAQHDAVRTAAWLQHLRPLFAEFDASPPPHLAEIYLSFRENRDQLALLCALRPAVVSFHFGIPDAPVITQLRQHGIYTMATATNSTEAQSIARAGIDAIVAQGIEAGGHRGMFDPHAHDQALTTTALVRLLSTQTTLPLIAAGGIMDGRDMAQALAAGAHAVQLGTAFLLCPEAATSPAYRAHLLRATANDTVFTSAISGRPARGLHNRLIAHGADPHAPLPPDYPLAYDAAKQLHHVATTHQNNDMAAHWAGTGVARIRTWPDAGTLVTTLKAELHALR